MFTLAEDLPLILKGFSSEGFCFRVCGGLGRRGWLSAADSDRALSKERECTSLLASKLGEMGGNSSGDPEVLGSIVSGVSGVRGRLSSLLPETGEVEGERLKPKNLLNDGFFLTLLGVLVRSGHSRLSWLQLAICRRRGDVELASLAPPDLPLRCDFLLDGVTGLVLS